MKMLRPLIVLLVLSSVWSCTKDEENINNPTSNNSTINNPSNPPISFDYRVVKANTFDFFVEQSIASRVLVEVRSSASLNESSDLLQRFTINANQLDSRDLELPSYLDQVYVFLYLDNGQIKVQAITLVGNSHQVVHQSSSNTSNKASTTVSNQVQCNSGCDTVITSDNGFIPNSFTGRTICFQPNLPSGMMGGPTGIRVQPSNNRVYEVKVCGQLGNSLTLIGGANTTFLLGSRAEILELESGSLVIGSNASVGAVRLGIGTHTTNYGSLSSSYTDFRSGGDADLILQNQAELINYGRINSANLSSNNGRLTNHGEVNVVYGIDFQGSYSFLKNYCSLQSVNLSTEGQIENYGLIFTEWELRFSSGSLTLGAESMIQGNRIILSSSLSLFGPDTNQIHYALIKAANRQDVAGVTELYSSNMQGKIAICDANGIEAGAARISNGAIASCSPTIPVSACNFLGHSTYVFVDSDQDGIPDEHDLEPNSPEVAFASFYPNSNSYATYMVEDLWPAQGDYDFNDLVVRYQYILRKNANNELVSLQIKLQPVANGGAHEKAMAIRFPVPPSNVLGVLGQVLNGNLVSTQSNGCETNQSDAVVFLFDRLSDILPNQGTRFVNTDPTEPKSIGQELNTVISFDNPIAENVLPPLPFDLFTVVRNERGREIHMLGNMPTDKANQALLNSGGNIHQPNIQKTYCDDAFFPWVINVEESISYPQEKADIKEVYNYFAPWANSNGQSNTDWYLDLPGNISSKVYR